jgi:hypothetical protein
VRCSWSRNFLLAMLFFTFPCRYLCDILADIDASGCGEHALVAYVKGVCLNKQGAKRAAMAALTHAVSVFPLNWSAWMEMLTISKKVALVPAPAASCPISRPARRAAASALPLAAAARVLVARSWRRP